MSKEIELLKFLLPEYLVEHFDIVKFEEKDKMLHLYFEIKHHPKRIFFTFFTIKRISCRNSGR